MSQNNPWSGSTADRRLFKYNPPSLIAASAAAAADPWLAAVDATTPILADSAGPGAVALVRFIVRDGFSVAATSDVVDVVASDTEVSSITLVAGTRVALVESAAAMGAGNTGIIASYLPDATGLVSITITYAATGTKSIVIRHRHIAVRGAVVLP